jgi:nuclear pore complex protein Nup188
MEMLSRPWQPFPGPSAQEKSKFEAKTAPVSVTPSPSGHYKIDEIREDALWLSQQARISEHAALRLVVIEWQSRPAVQILSGLTQEEALSVRDAAGLSSLSASTLLPNSSIVTAPSSLPDTHFDSADQRKLRLIGVYHTTCASILRVSQLLISWATAPGTQPTHGPSYRVYQPWLEHLGYALTIKQKGNSASPLESCLDAVKGRVSILQAGFTWNVPDTIQEAAVESWVTAQFTALVHILHIALLHADLFTPKFVSAPAIRQWFDLAQEQAFFMNVQLPLPSQQHLAPLLHLLTSLLSLAVLKIDLVLDDLETGQYATWDPSLYVLNGKLLEDITDIFGYAKQLGPSPATPPAFAWAIMTFKLTTEAREVETNRDSRIENNGSRGSLPGSTPLEEATLYITQMDSELFDKKLPFEDLAEVCSSFGVLQIITQLVDLGRSAFGTVIDRQSSDRIRLVLFNLLRNALGSGIVEYTNDLIICAHTIMAGDRTFLNWTGNDALRYADPVTAFCLRDEAILLPMLITQARARYPYEIVPWLQLSSAIVRGEGLAEDGLSAVVHMFSRVPTFMQRMPEGFREFQGTYEDENDNWVRLKEELPLFSIDAASTLSSSRMQLGFGSHTTSDETMIIPAETIGNVADDTAPPFVAVWWYEHSAFDYLVRLLSTYVVGSRNVEHSSRQPISLETATEIMGFFADLLHSSLRGEGGDSSESASSAELLIELGVSFDRNQDTVSIVLSIFEQELLQLCQNPGSEERLQLLVNCLRFIEALIKIVPNRVWPWLVRSRLLETDGNASGMANVLIGTELVIGRYEFLLACISVFNSLIEDAIGQSVARKTSSRALTRFRTAVTTNSGTSNKIMSSTLLTFGRTLASMFEGTLSWKYARTADRLEITTRICTSFTTILEYAYGIDDVPTLSAKLTGLVGPLAEYITDHFLAVSQSNMRTNPIVATLLSGADVEKNSFLAATAVLWKRQTHASLAFSNTLVRVAALLNKPWTHIEQQLFKATPLLARLYATHDTYKGLVLVLLQSLVRGALRVVENTDIGEQRKPDTKGLTEPPSLLGHLGPRTAKDFLSVLSLLDEPLQFVEIQTQIWGLLSAVVTSKQQWFALYLLTGTTPRESLKSRTTPGAGSSRNKALLSRALDSIAKLDLTNPDIDWALFTAMLEFVSSAQNHWSWALGDLRQRKEFIQKLLAFLKWLPTQPRNPETLAGVETQSHLNKFAACTCEILAMHLHSSRQAGDVTPLKDVISSLAYLADKALQQPSYKTSLHLRLEQNFEKQFPGVSLAQLKRTTLYPVHLGPSFFYNIDLANQLLGFDKTWSGRARGEGFSADVERANLNLGLVESEMNLLRGWKVLAVELSNVMDKDQNLAGILIKAVKDCMDANADTSLPEELFGHLRTVRLDLAFIILQRILNSKVKGANARPLLGPIWKAIRASTEDFDTIFSSDKVHHYRSLLRVLYLNLQFHVLDDTNTDASSSFRSSFRGTLPAKSKDLVEPISSQLLEVLSDTVAKGFRSMATQLHSDPSSVLPSDFALLTAILQTTLAIPEMKVWHAQAALLFSNSNTIRYATSLFSWSDRLAIPNSGINDPVYGELSILFILSLSTMQSLAESMAVEGILSQLNTANLMNYYRRPGGMSPFDSPPRLFSIWTRGILPLCLNLLRAVGPAIAGEISAFLNQFPEQLTRASNTLNSRTTNLKITLSIASEMHSLALISSILEAIRAQGPRLGVQSSDIPLLDWDKDNVKEDIEGWMARKGALREKIVPTDEVEAQQFAKKLIQDGAAENVLEERVVRELEAAGICLGVGQNGNGGS